MIEALLSDGWGYHDTESERLASELESVAVVDVPPEQAGEMLNLSNHTIGEHLGDWPRARLLAEKVQTIIPRRSNGWLSLAVARYMDGDPGNAQVAAMRYVCSREEDAFVRHLVLNAQLVGSLAGSGRFEEASVIYDAMLELADDDSALPSDRSIAVTSNNLAMDLLNRSGRDAVRDSLMCRAAQAGLTFWRKCGTWENEERAFYGLALVHNAIGDFTSALAHAAEALRVIEANGGEHVDEAFVRLAASQAHRSLGDIEAADIALARADEISSGWSDSGLVNWFSTEREKVVQ